jgi:catechol 2,3-dioxygenase
MPGVHRFEHAELRVEDLDTATEFYTDVIGLAEIYRNDGTVYLGTGLDENYDVALREDGTGIAHFAVRVSGTDDLDRYEERLGDAGVDTVRNDGEGEPGQESGLRFDLPCGTRMELVTVDDRRYHHSNEAPAGAPGGTAPVDVDHITLVSPDVEANAQFLADHLDFTISSVVEGEEGEWEGAFTRHGDYHHDIAFLPNPVEELTIHHMAWEVRSIDHMKAFIDRLSQHGTDLELGIGRHYAGDNIFSYFWTRGGNRIELTAEMATVDPEAETEYMPFERALSAWGPIEFSDSFLKDAS